MDKWLERWLADRKPIDQDLMVNLSPHRYGVEYQSYEDGARDFLHLLRQLDQLRITALGWTAKDFSLWEDEEAYLADAIATAETSDYAEEDGSIGIIDNVETLLGSQVDKTYYAFNYSWGRFATQLNADFEHFHPNFEFTADDMIALVDAVTRWKRPQHLEFGPSGYFQHHHPLARARSGIRWIGWVPFALAPSDVPEAELVQPMNGGTLIATQMAFWQVFEHHPYYSKQAIERAQEVELRLNLLGVLPTAVELDRGDWGR